MTLFEDLSEQELIRLRSVVKFKLTTFIKYLRDLDQPTESDISQLEFRLERLSCDSEKFNHIQKWLTALASDDMKDVREQEHVEFETAFYNAKNEADVMINKYRAFLSSPNQSTCSLIIQNSDSFDVSGISKYNGSWEEWPSFSATFKAVIHNNTRLTDVQKLICLRYSLTDKAAENIKSLETTASNYFVAWKILETRYNNPLAIIYPRVKALLELPTVKHRSVKSLNKIIDAAEIHCSVLEAMNRPLFEVFPLFALTSKLDEQTLLLWQNSRQGLEFPKIRELLDFLYNRRKALEVVQSTNNAKIAENHRRRLCKKKLRSIKRRMAKRK